MDIKFLGTGGGRINLVKQIRSTAGFLVHGSKSIYVDPGPGAIVQAAKYGVNWEMIDCLFISHVHVDHCSDANVVVEGITSYTFEKRGVLLGSRNSLEGNRRFERCVTKFHQSKLEAVKVMEAGDSYELGEMMIEATPTKHGEDSCIGFKITDNGICVGYTSDTEYFEELGNVYKNCDVLILNNLKPAEDGLPGHLHTGESIKILKQAKPKLAVLTHIGLHYEKPPKFDAQRITEETGVNCIAARDGMIVNEGGIVGEL